MISDWSVKSRIGPDRDGSMLTKMPILMVRRVVLRSRTDQFWPVPIGVVQKVSPWNHVMLAWKQRTPTFIHFLPLFSDTKCQKLVRNWVQIALHRWRVAQKQVHHKFRKLKKVILRCKNSKNRVFHVFAVKSHVSYKSGPVLTGPAKTGPLLSNLDGHRRVLRSYTNQFWPVPIGVDQKVSPRKR